MLAEDVRADELDVLRDVGLGGADARDALLHGVQQGGAVRLKNGQRLRLRCWGTLM